MKGCRCPLDSQVSEFLWPRGPKSPAIANRSPLPLQIGAVKSVLAKTPHVGYFGISGLAALGPRAFVATGLPEARAQLDNTLCC